MNKKFVLAIAAAAGIAAAATTSLATPLPDGTILTIIGTTDAPGLVKCTNGSCFGMRLTPDLIFWTPLFPGTDGGIIIGKSQMSGGQDLNYTSNADGEITAAWSFAHNNGTFFTAPSDAGNIFDDASCTGSGCGSNTTPRKTDLAVWNMAWYGMVIPLGSSVGCDPLLYSNCTPEQQNGIFVKSWTIDQVAGTWSLEYGQVTKDVFVNFPFELVLRGKIGYVILPAANVPPVAKDVVVEGNAGAILTWTPVVSDSDGPDSLTCFLVGNPANGSATIAYDCSSGSYTSAAGFSGIDTFTYAVTDGRVNSYATVTAGITGTPSTACTLANPVRQVTYNSKSKLTMVVTGNISKTTNKEVRICPTTRLEYYATSTVYPVTCYINNVMAAPKGSVTVGSELKCNVKPYAGDEYKVNIKSAI